MNVIQVRLTLGYNQQELKGLQFNLMPWILGFCLSRNRSAAKIIVQIFSDDPDIPPGLRGGYKCEKSATGPLDRQKLLDFISEQVSSATCFKPGAQE